MVWVKVHEELCKGDKRDLSRATRFIYIELCLEARRRLDVRDDGSTWIPLPAKGTLVQAIRDIIGGNPMEIRHAIEALTEGPDPMLAVVQVEASSGPARRSLVVRSWVAWNQVDDSSKRVAKHREEKRALTNDVTRYSTVSNGPVTLLDQSRVEEIRSEIPPNPPAGGMAGDDPSVGSSSGLPPAPPSSPTIRLTQREQAVAAALADDRSLAPIVPDASALAVKLCANFPGVDLVAEIAAAGEWCRAKPAKAPKKSAERFLISTWLKGKDPNQAWVVKAYLAGLKRFQKIDRAALDIDAKAAVKVVKESGIQAAHRAAQKLGGFEPTWRDVATHWLEAYLRLDDAKLSEQGYPLAYMLTRINVGDLPTRPRKRDAAAGSGDAARSTREPAPTNDPPPEDIASPEQIRQLGLGGGFGDGPTSGGATILQRPRFS